MNYFSCFVYATISLSDAESHDSKTSANNSISYTMYSKHNLPLETRILVELACMEIYLWKRQAHEIHLKTIIKGDILGKIQSAYTVRRNRMYNLHAIRMADSSYSKAKSNNN